MAAETILIYGDSESYKTSNLGPLADWLFTQYGGITRLITSDSGVGPLRDQIQRGVIQVWSIAGSQYYAGVLRRASMGYWPESIDPLTYQAGDVNRLRQTTAREWLGVSGVFMEGLTKNADGLMGHLLGAKGNAPQATGEPLTGMFDELGMKFASSSRGTYKSIQEQVLHNAALLCALPVRMVVMTAHESKGEDLTKKTIFGPAVAGKALTDKMTSCFQNSLHFEAYMSKFRDKDGKEFKRPGVRAFFQKHVDSEVPGIFWPAKLGVTPQVKAMVLEAWPHGYLPLKIDKGGNYVSGVHTLFEFIEKANEAVTAQWAQASAEPEPEQELLEAPEPEQQTEGETDGSNPTQQ